MLSKVKPPVTIAALVLAACALAGCAATTPPRTADSSEAPSPTPDPVETDAVAVGCTDPAWIGPGTLSGALFDGGARELAAGTVGLDADGTIVSYTVAPGDAPYAIGDRLCIENALSLAELNHTRTIHPGQVLRLNPDPSVRWIPYYNPSDAPAGFQQIPYQSAIEAMGTAADAGDVDTMRAIWADGLAAMFTDPRDIDAIQEALDVGDLEVLRQMFS